MDLYQRLSLTPVRHEPDVWVRRLVIYEQTTPDVRIIRDISLTRGLNIVWAEEPDDDDASAEIAGHSAGKTTFCRLLRHVLGERTYGTKSNTELIRRSLPSAYVGAELFVKGQLWAVLRPIGNGRASYVKQGIVLEALLEDRGQSVTLDNYVQAIGLDALLDDLDAGTVVRTGETILWGHLLAWSARDQEARFQNIHEWRSSRSESEWPQFRFSKADPLFVMRCVLGLFLPDELKAEEAMASLLQRQEQLEKRLEELKREPQFRVNLYSDELRRRLRVLLPEEPDIETLPFHSNTLLPDLHKLAKGAISTMELNIAGLERERAQAQEEVDVVGGQIRQRESRLHTIEAQFALEGGATHELESGLGQRQRDRGYFDDYGEKLCILGGILYQNCDYVKGRQADLRITRLQDAHATEQAAAKRAELLKSIGEHRDSIRSDLERLRIERSRLQAERDALATRIREHRDAQSELVRSDGQLGVWMSRATQANAFADLARCEVELRTNIEEAQKTKDRLTLLLEQHAANRDLLASIFSGAVRAVLTSGTYDGRVSLDNRELSFRIMHGAAMSGEAVETLSVLLADVSCLTYNSVSENSHLPGILLHDSPREADLGERIYRSLIRFIASLEGHFGTHDVCPFQYIITTTTAPPEELCTPKHLRVRLDASKSDGLLFRRSLAPPSDADARLFAE